MKAQTSLLPLVIGVILVVGIVTAVLLDFNKTTSNIKSFSSYEELQDYVKTSFDSDFYGFGSQIMRTTAIGDVATGIPTAAQIESGDGSKDFSQTNVQVKGVDEADIVKTDGEYIYVVSGKKVYLIDADPFEIVSEIEADGRIQEIFVNDNKLILFGQEQFYYGFPETFPVGIAIPAADSGSSEGSTGETEAIEDSVAAQELVPITDDLIPGKILPPRYTPPKAFTKVYDISDRSNPELIKDMELNGSYYDSRMIGGHVYIIINTPIQRDNIVVPLVMEDGVTRSGFPEVFYFDNPTRSYRFTTIMSVDLETSDVNSKIYMMGYSDNLYVSEDHIYITYRKYVSQIVLYERIIDEAVLPLTPADVDNEINEWRRDGINSRNFQEFGEIIENYFNRLSENEKETFMKQMQEKVEEISIDFAREMEKTVIQKIFINNGEIDYVTEGSVPGTLLNQFSMDQKGDYFRVATTSRATGFGFRQVQTSNNVYVLDSSLNIVGELEDLAPGESIFSVRFIGDKAYLVTFKKIDPLFVIDLSQPSNPKVLGKLKIPGFSDYMHPFDENHIIGIGKEAIPDDNRDFAWYQGLKIALFDVSDVENPKQLYSEVIGDRGTDSYALRDHKAFLFSKERNLLVIPVLLAELKGDVNELPKWSYGEYTYQGAYVYELTAENGFDLQGRITHFDSNEDFLKSGYYFGSDFSIQRSLYIDDILYTISNEKIKANKLSDMEEIDQIRLV